MIRTQTPPPLYEPMTCDAEKITGEMPDMMLVEEYIRKHGAFIGRYKYLNGLYKGFHGIYSADPKDDYKPDARLAVNFPKYITKISLGYGYGVPITKKFVDENLQEAVKGFEKRNHIQDHDSRLFKACFKYGHAWEFFYQDERANTRMKVLSPAGFFCVYNSTMDERALFAVRYGKKADGATTYGEVYTRTKVREFVGSSYVGEIRDNPYGLIPAVEYMLDDERMGVYEDVAPLIEAYNFTISEKTNDVDAFAEAYLIIAGTEVDDDGVRRIRDQRIINIWGTDDAGEVKAAIVNFLAKPTADATQENLLNRLERLIFQISMAANISDDSFGNVASGEALAYKLLATGTMLSTFDTKIEKSLQKRYKIFCSLSTNYPSPDAWEDVEITFHRNAPKNVSAEIKNAQDAAGIVSTETQLGLMPSVVPDVGAEMERIKKEAQTAREAASAYGGAFTHSHDETAVSGAQDTENGPRNSPGGVTDAEEQ